MKRRRRNKIIAIALLLLLLLLLSVAYVNYRRTRTLGFGLAVNAADTMVPPQFLYSFTGGEGQERMRRPIGVLVDGADVFVTDGELQNVYRFALNGRLKGIFGTGKTVVPLYIAKHPKTGNLYISDRRTRSIHIFKRDGTYVGEFDPKLPKAQISKFAPKGAQWAPVALAFASDGTLYVTELLTGHRLLIFGPDGKFKRSVGNAGFAPSADEATELFQFPNSVKVHGDEVWVADSNNRRVKVYSRTGDFKRVIDTGGLPRGLDFLNRFSTDNKNSPTRFVTIDTLAHDGTVWKESGDKLVNFGENGVLDGQFQYPTDISVAPKNLMFIADTNNARVQVWGWPTEAPPIPIRAPRWWPLCFTPLLLLPLLLLLRKIKFYATADFVEAMLLAEKVHTMPHRRRKWLVSPEDYELLKDQSQDEVDLGELLEAVEVSESDAKAIVDKYEVEWPVAYALARAQRTKVFCTEDIELRRLAKTMDLDVVNRDEFLERFGKTSAEPKGGGTPPQAPVDDVEPAGDAPDPGAAETPDELPGESLADPPADEGT